jgi:ATP-binding cassette subfamily B protein
MRRFPWKITDDPYGAFQLIKRLVIEQGATYWPRYLLVFILMAIGSAASAGSAYLFGKVINAAYVYRSVNDIMTLSAVVICLFTAKGFATYWQAVILSRISNAILASNQRKLFAKLMQESVGFYAKSHSSEHLNRLSAGASSITQILSLLITTAGRDLLTLVGLLIVMVTQDPLMSLLSLVIAPPMFLFVRKIVRLIRQIATSQFASGAHILEIVQESLQGIRTVKAFTLEDAMQRRVEQSVADIETHANKMAKISNSSSPLMEMLGGIAIAGALMYGGYRVIATDAAPGQFISFITAFLLAYEPAKRLARLNIDLSGLLIGARMLLEIIDAPASEPDDGDKPALNLTCAQIEFRDVTFAYRPGEPVLKSMSFVAEPGKVTALVGPSGGGKSTILSLLLRFYEAGEGAVVIDDQDLTKCSRISLRQQTTYVGQDVYLFRGTIRENIAFGKAGATESDIVAAAKAAYAHDFISSFPLGYDTPVGEHGTQLSGGQRQRVAIARALVKDAPIILFDEATAALDSESEKFVQEAIAHLCKDRTTIVIAHRLHTIMRADQILVIEGGEVVETGRHDELLQKDGRYAAFFRLQQRESHAGEAAALLAKAGE